jgi:hypothetical protein
VLPRPPLPSLPAAPQAPAPAAASSARKAEARKSLSIFLAGAKLGHHEDGLRAEG